MDARNIESLDDRIQIQPQSNTSLMEEEGARKTGTHTQVDMIKAWNKFSAVRFCSDVPEMRAMRPP